MTKEEQQQKANNVPSASAQDADQHMLGDTACSAESARIDAWTNPKFAQGGRQQAQLDDSYPYREKRTGK
jgi:hypothetical protein